MEIKQTHLIALLLLGVLAVSWYSQRVENRKAADRALAANVEACKRNSARVSISAAGWDAVARALVKAPKEAVANVDAVATSTREYIPVPKGVPFNEPHASETQTVLLPSGERLVQITPRAAAIQAAGCERAYGD